MKIHITKSGETLYQVAERYKVDVNVLYGHNQHIADPHNLQEGLQLTIPSLVGLEGVMAPKLDGKGNVCAYVADEPVQYNKLNIKHWPSQDYTQPIYGTHFKEKDFQQAEVYPQYPHYPQHPQTPMPVQQQHRYPGYYQYQQPNHWNY
ncbi:LysM peptidoglycan-binding domain-containing protein [Anaerobacillus sp. CMMVII]|uniref:LysM peptidoglycan-binding domain-containing protein n=1 Tax=Anaerobacillus sp. CMMVII TaxID=2755588 RepID=UPI0021B7335B|nr:LysM domain-containing protein [Anaerobacillus sp. CMMVII]MCT8136649.1 LysM peptidoglycan-binding domain-containing protein [Anaerobacillus sp. CMMVII]